MVEVVEERSLAWDAFLQREATKPGGTKVDIRRDQIDGFRRVDWPNIRRQLATDFHWELPQGLEPNWVEPGRAVLWQEHILRKPVLKHRDDGTTYRVMEDHYTGEWHPTSSGLPLGNASQIAHWLDKGFRLRPPVDGVDAKTYESSGLSDALQAGSPEAEDTRQRWACSRHRNSYVLWKMYMEHCLIHMETPEHDVPEAERQRMSAFPFWCVMCWRGFKNNSGATRHRKTPRHKRAELKVHQITVEDMRVRLPDEGSTNGLERLS